MSGPTVRDVEQQLRTVMSSFDAALLSVADAAELRQVFTSIKRLAETGELATTKRVAETAVVRTRKDPTGSRWAGRQLGVSDGQAAALLELADQLEQLPATKQALEQGRISREQAAEIARTASVVPDAEPALLQAAPRESVGELKRRGSRLRASAPGTEARLKQMRARRELRTWTDTDGAGRGSWTCPPDMQAELLAFLRPFHERAFQQARREGRRESSDAYAIDALLAMARAANDEDASDEAPDAQPGAREVSSASGPERSTVAGTQEVGRRTPSLDGATRAALSALPAGEGADGASVAGPSALPAGEGDGGASVARPSALPAGEGDDGAFVATPSALSPGECADGLGGERPRRPDDDLPFGIAAGAAVPDGPDVGPDPVDAQADAGPLDGGPAVEPPEPGPPVVREPEGVAVCDPGLVGSRDPTPGVPIDPDAVPSDPDGTAPHDPGPVAASDPDGTAPHGPGSVAATDPGGAARRHTGPVAASDPGGAARRHTGPVAVSDPDGTAPHDPGRAAPNHPDAFGAGEAAAGDGRAGPSSGEVGSDDGSRKRKRRRPSSGERMKVIVRVDAAALQRGEVAGGELCEVVGIGAVPVESVRRWIAEDAFVAVVLTKGQDVSSIVHLGRSPTALQRTLLEWEQPECQVLGCHASAVLEIDHSEEWSRTRHTTTSELDRFCPRHHEMKTHDGYRLEPGRGKRRFLSPEEQAAMPPHPPDPLRLADAPDPDGSAGPADSADSADPAGAVGPAGEAGPPLRAVSGRSEGRDEPPPSLFDGSVACWDRRGA